MRVIRAPDEVKAKKGERLVFLAGGISNCPDWQGSMPGLLGDIANLAVINPRRIVAFGKEGPEAAGQIKWEHDALRKADAHAFWFCANVIQPISLFELGVWSEKSERLFVGVDPFYPRRFDIVEQLKLSRPGIHVLDSLAKVAQQVRAWANNPPLRVPKPYGK